MAPQLRPGILDPSTNNPFAHPSGWLGRLAGRFMLWNNKQDEVVGVLGVQPGHDVLEIGYGPGGLIRLLAERTQAASIRGVDPSPQMRDQARRHNRSAVRADRVRLDLGTADRTGLPGASVDRVVSVNNVAIWPDLEAAVGELHRVVRQGGSVVIAWHGGTTPSRIARSLRLPEDELGRIEQVLRDHFGQVARRQLAMLDVFTAAR
ncbi:class I SAM-dependent methyltransferase [Mycobacterium sp.]|jgi:ubiquinone/menaquinone biosynthesis C-methylase UbiE|uniref:class I SAM-dependent methyltransferase n=1 Tax=Mycobacterium sp. TaxID=1785 RepID=UPI0033401619